MKKPNLLILAHARHGKDTLAAILRDKYGYTFKSSSEAANEICVFPVLSKVYGYATLEECFEDRINHRAEWFDLITAYNTPDKTRLAKKILETSDIYVGMRNKDELEACISENVFDVIVWLDASGRVPPEPSESCTVGPEMADLILFNNGTLGDLESEAEFLVNTIGLAFYGDY